MEYEVDVATAVQERFTMDVPLAVPANEVGIEGTPYVEVETADEVAESSPNRFERIL